jgi:hypothetical protein
VNYIPLATSAGPRRASPPSPPKRVFLTAEELHLFLRALNLEAATAEQSGDYARADRLAIRAAALQP